MKRLASDGKLMIDECERAKRSDMLIIFDKFFSMNESQEQILVYGAGNVAGKIYKIFEKMGCLKKICAFIVNCTEENEKELGGIKVQNYKEFISSSEKIIVGLCETKQEEIYKDLIATGVKEERIIKLSPLINKLIAIF